MAEDDVKKNGDWLRCPKPAHSSSQRNTVRRRVDSFACRRFSTLSPLGHLRLLVWLAIGQIIYFTYSRHHSRVRQLNKQQ